MAGSGRTAKGITAINGPPARPLQLTVPISLDEEMSQRALALETIRELCSVEEQLPCSLDAPIRHLYRGSVEHNETVHIIGRAGDTRLEQSPSLPFGSSFNRIKLSLVAELGPGERLGLITWHGGAQQDDPVLHELTWLFQQAAKSPEP